ncbi:methyl-accepting chemotaxis protein [Myxosarcina sp. GI1(2024)]
MASGTNYSQVYEQAEQAYSQGNFTLAAEIIDRLADEFPEDPNVLLLRGHIYCYGFQDYDTARQLYEEVLKLSEERDLLNFAYDGIEAAQQLQQQSAESEVAFDEDDFDLEANSSMGSDFAEVEPEFDENFDFEVNNFVSEVSDDGIEDSNSMENPFAAENPDISELSDTGSDAFAEFDAMTENFAESENFSSDYLEENHNGSLSEIDLLEGDSEDRFAFSDDEENYRDRHSDEPEMETALSEPYIEDDDESAPGGLEARDELDAQGELEFDEIDSSFFDLEELEQGLPDTGLFNVTDESANTDLVTSSVVTSSEINSVSSIKTSEDSSNSSLNTSPNSQLKPQVDIKQGALAGFLNAPIQKKQLIIAGVTGVVTTLAVLGIGAIATRVPDEADENNFALRARNSFVMSLVGGVASFGTAAAIGSVTAKQVQRASQDLQSQFDDVYRGNLNAKATVYSQDELGRLADGFNRMTRVISTTTQEAQKRAEETEQAKEDLQRQVIRLLDDVEGAARGDLTVQATVTADVLGAVADAFNLTIQSLREIVRQVKEAAEQVNQGSTDSELFARNQSSEALRMAEELAVTLNSVQMMTESFERVADNAREAEEVARSSSVTALKGGKAVESTVSGIFQIRETVSETARKVKRLAEASQEISKIVLLISQIAERTNQLALNASIQAAKAGEAGRGFAVVADEVRQLADRSGKSLKEIEQIVLQIQSETGSVMTAMEEGIQEVIDVTNRADQAKTALEDIIQVSNRIDTLVRSITADTVEQRENSRAVAQVMQSVELTAQATSQESQRVAGALQSLVAIARSLLSSVERFRIDKEE